MSDNDSEYGPQNPEGDGHEFEMPASDGIESGVPLPNDLKAIKNASNYEQKSIAADLTPEGLNSRLKASQMTRNQGSIGQATVQGTEAWASKNNTSSLSIKFKLISSLGILTFLIILLGVVSILAIGNLNSLSDNIFERYSPLARITEEIKATVYQIRRAEQEFLLNEEQSALDTSNRLVAKLRGQVDEAINLGEEIAQETGKRADIRIKEVSSVLDLYEQTFVNQVKNIIEARTDINKNLVGIEALKGKLLVELSANKRLVQGIVDDYWIEGKEEALGSLDLSKKVAETALKAILANKERTLNSNSNSNRVAEDLKAVEAAAEAAGEALDVTKVTAEINRLLVENGILLQNLNISVGESESFVARYLQENQDLYADSAFKEIETAINIANRIRREVDDDGLSIKMAQVVKSLDQYRSLLRAGQTRNKEVFTAREVVEAEIQRQKDELEKIGDEFLKQTTVLSNGAWEQVAEVSRLQISTGNFNQLLLLTTVAVGSIIGLLVLWLIPRPILASINQLLIGAQAVAGGDLSQSITVGSNDELGLLANNFNSMRLNLMQLVERIQKASMQISTTVNEIQAASTEQSGTATEQASTITQFSATLREISQNGTALSESASSVASDANEMTNYVNETNSRSENMMASMGTIGDSTEQTSERIKSLNDQMDGIVDAVNVISSVSDQTTLLSLNAAIEANKAGEMGKGFSVVATEIRRLADRSVDSADTINTLIRDIQRSAESSLVSMDKSSSEIKQGVDLVEQTSNAMAYLNKNIGRVGEQAGSISSGIKQQADASRDVELTAAQLLESSRMTAQAAGQTSAASYELAGMSNQLSEAVAAFKV